MCISIVLCLLLSPESTLGGAVELASALSGEGAREPREPGYRILHWTADNGLPQNTVQCLLQTHDGYLWIGTMGGLARFDGMRFTVFSRVNTSAFISDNCLSLAEDSAGQLLIGTANGLLRLEKGGFKHIALPGDAVQSICPSRTGRIWLGTRGTLFTLQNEVALEWTNYPGFGTSEGKITNNKTIVEDQQGCIWVGGSGRLLRQTSLGGPFVEVRPPGSNINANVLSLIDQKQVALANGLGVFRIHSDQIEQIVAAGSNFQHACAPVQDSRMRMWVPTEGFGLHAFQNGKLRNVSIGEDFDKDDMLSALLDREGNLWVGGRRNGLVCIQPRVLFTLTTHDGLAHNDVWSVNIGRSGEVWVGHSTGVNCYSNGGFTELSPELKNPSDSLHPILVDASGNLWARADTRLVRFSQGKMEVMRDYLERSFDFVYSIYQASNSAVWIGTRKGVHKWDGNGWTDYVLSYNQNTRHKHVTSILEDAKGTIWFGTTQHGLHSIENGIPISRYTTNDGLASNFCFPVLAEPDGLLWIVSDKGFSLLKDGYMKQFTPSDGLPNDVILNLVLDDYGGVWLNGHRGIYKLFKSEIMTAREGRLKKIRCLQLSGADGLLSVEGNGDCFPNSCKGKDGMLWFPTTKGVVVVDPRLVNTLEIPPPVVIETVWANNKAVQGDGAADSRSDQIQNGFMQLKPDEAQVLQISYTAPTFGFSGKVRFRRRLEGVDKEWDEPTESTTAVYPNLRPGKYKFTVIACNDHNIWNESGASFGFVIHPYFYQTWTFYLFTALGVFALGWGLHFWRLRYQRRFQSLQHALALERERLRIAHDIHDDVGSRLLQLSVLGEMVRRNLNSAKEAEPHLRKLDETSKEIFRAMDEIVWTVNPRQDSVEGLASYIREYATEFLSPVGIHSRFDFPQLIPAQPLKAEVRHHLFLLVKEVLNNVVKHSKATEVWIRLRVKERELTILFEDNGCGFVLPAAETAVNGNGLGSMRNRIAELRGHMALESKPGRGTIVTFQVPVE